MTVNRDGQGSAGRPTIGEPMRQLLSSSTVGATAGAAAGVLVNADRLKVAWQGADVGMLEGSLLGMLLGALVVSLGESRRGRTRAWVIAHGRGFAAAMLLTPPLLSTLAIAAMMTVVGVLRRVSVPEVAAVVVVGAVLGLTALGALVGVALGVRLAARSPARGNLGAIIVRPLAGGVLIAGALAGAYEFLLSLFSIGRGWWTPGDVLRTAEESVDVRSALSLTLTLLLIAPCAALLRRHSSLALVARLGALALFASLAAYPGHLVVATRPGLHRTVIGVLQRLTDADHDGYSRRFGGGDCDDHNASVHPGAVEVPGNGRDDDCDGEDLDPGTFATLDAPDPMTPDVERELRARLPAGGSLVLLTVDALRADLHYAGNPRNVSPNLDRLAARSIVFTRAYSTATYTVPSLASVVSGRYVDELARTSEARPRFDARNTFVAERLTSAGWRSEVMTACEVLHPARGLVQGFSSAHLDLIPARYPGGTVTDVGTADRTLALVSWAGEFFDQRLFSWTHFFDPHSEYVPRPEFGDFGPAPAGSYWQEVASTDQQIGRVLDGIDRLREEYRRRVIVIVTADHGESLGEHGTTLHGTSVWEEQMHVPLMIYIPGLEPRRVDTPRSLIDLAPTVLDLLGLPKPARDAPDSFSGVSLVPDLLGRSPPQRPIHAHLPAGVATYQDQSALIDGRWKLIRQGADRFSLFDLSADPHELVDLAASQPRQLSRMRQLLSAFRARLHVVAPTAPPAR